VENAVKENINCSVKQLKFDIPILSNKVDAGKLLIAVMLDTGGVILL
jgi:hypothetical protein